jgi:hypothetical protein
VEAELAEATMADKDIGVQDKVDIAVEYIAVRMMVDKVPDKQIVVGVEA